ncbi:MAG: P-II family nitrogen regulator [Planctomycetaceae bacterium]
MRMLVALIQPAKLKAVQDALAKIGVDRMTVCDAAGYGQQLGQTFPKTAAATTPANSPARLIRKIAIEIAVNEDFIDKTVETITHAARTGTEGRIGDGKIFLLPLEEVIRLSDTVRGPEGVS